jgi:hypothetical protein
MNKCCGVCAFWEYKGDRDEYDENQGYCWKTLGRKMCNDKCDEFIVHPMILEER